MTRLGVGIGDVSPGLFRMAKIDGRLMPIKDALARLASGPVEGDVDLRGADIAALPEATSVSGWLNLRCCTSLTHLPDGLTVGGWLNLSGCVSLTNLPNDMEIGGVVYGREDLLCQQAPAKTLGQ